MSKATKINRIIRLATPTSNVANFFADMQTAEGSDLGVVKTALVATEGSFNDSDGNPHTFTPERLNTIADFTNKALDNGTEVPVCQDHEVSVDTTIGKIEGQAYTKLITPDDLPNKKSTHLIGKLGLFVSQVAINAKDAADKVSRNILNSVSMGLNLDPNDQRIMELSLVPIPAIPNMGLFKHARAQFTQVAGGIAPADNAFTWEELEVNKRSLDDLREEYDDLTQNLWNILTNIYTSDTIEITDFDMLRQYVYSALNGFSTRVVDLVGLSEQEAEIQQAAADQSATLTAEQAQQMNAVQANDITGTGFKRKYTVGKFAVRNSQSGLLERASFKALLK
jgi:hypothetical protein